MVQKLASNLEFDAGFSRLKDRVIERTGHFYYHDKDDLLWERIRKRLRATGCTDAARYLEHLDDPALGPREWAHLEAGITIGETFFFRYAEQFTALREKILPEIIERRRGERRLRIWSAGCATGAEPYSIAILLNQLLGNDLQNWRVSIVGSDINEGFLETARRASYGSWPLRALSSQDRATFFEPVESEGQWQLKKEYRSLVRFERHNLLSLLDGTSPLQFTEFDLVLCRNVLIYFHPATVVQIVEALNNTLREGGWMLLGHAEPNPAFASFLQVINLPGTTAYRRGPVAEPSAEPPLERIPIPSQPPQLSPLPPVQQTLPGQPVWKMLVPAPVVDRPPPTLPLSPSTLLAEIRALADAGRFEVADKLCQKALADQPLNPALHYFEGLIAQAMERPSTAEKAFRRSIYLDKSFAMAHYHLGLLLLADGRHGAGRRSLANAARIVSLMPGATVLDEADGLTAQEMRDLVRLHLGILVQSGLGG